MEYNLSRRRHETIYKMFVELRKKGLQKGEAYDEIAKKYFVSRSTVTNAVLRISKRNAQQQMMQAQ